MNPSSSGNPRLAGLLDGAIGVLIFSLTVPAMRIAVRALDPAVVGVGRMAIAAVPAALYLMVQGSPRLNRRQIASLCLVTACLVLGFSWLSARALRVVPGCHAAIVIGGIPLATALFATLRGGRRQPPLFWIAALAGSLIVAGYGFWKSGGLFSTADLLLLAAAFVCGLGYAEGARLGKEIGTTVLACWVPLAALPIVLVVCHGKWPSHPGLVPWTSWAALLYNALFSAFIGFLFWYRGLARGGSARIGQLQLAQPFLTLAFAPLLLHETAAPADWLAAAAVVGCIALSQSASVIPRAAARGAAPAAADRATTASP